MNNHKYIDLENVVLDFPIFNNDSFSLRSAVSKLGMQKRFVGDDKGHTYVRGLKGINLKLQQGDRIALLGPNGAGKSTLLKVMARIYHPTRGNVRINGTLSSLLDIGLGMDNEATGIENIYLICYVKGIQKTQIDKLVDEIVEFADIGDFIHLPVRTYSSGMQIRLIFSIATAIIPDILLIDEVIGAGDEKFLEKAKTRTINVMNRASILVFASHNVSLVRANCNKGAVLKDGEIVYSGDVEGAIEYHQNDMKN